LITPIDFKTLSKKYPTPFAVQKYLRKIPYNKEKDVETQRSADAAVRKGSMHCLEAVFVAAAILEHAAYPPLILSLESKDNLDHVVFIFKEKSRWGAVGKSRMEGLHGRKPVFRSVRDLAWSYFDPFIDETGRLSGYAVTNLDKLRGDWRCSSRNVWTLVNDLINMPHKKLRSSEKRYKKFYHYYKATGFSGVPKPTWW
jgi:hypothetical protein